MHQTKSNKPKKALVKLPFPIQKADDSAAAELLEAVRPKPQHYADRTWMPPRGTRKSMGKR